MVGACLCIASASRHALARSLALPNNTPFVQLSFLRGSSSTTDLALERGNVSPRRRDECRRAWGSYRDDEVRCMRKMHCASSCIFKRHLCERTLWRTLGKFDSLKLKREEITREGGLKGKLACHVGLKAIFDDSFLLSILPWCSGAYINLF